LFAVSFLILITSMKIKVQIEPTTIASIRVKPCGENVAHWSTGQLPTEPRSATQPIACKSSKGIHLLDHTAEDNPALFLIAARSDTA
jgi:hypothetical protein